MKTDRSLDPPASDSDFPGLVAWLDRTRVRLPLKGIECRFDVRGDVANIELDQIYHQDNTQPLDCLYTFPLPARAAVYRCELHVNGRVVAARVEEVEKARAIAKEKMAQGHRTALVEYVRENVFELALGNLMPGDVVIVRLAYVETLDRLGEELSMRIPFCPGVRYIPGTPLLRQNRGRGNADDTSEVPDASRLSPPRVDSLHPDGAYLAVDGRIFPLPRDAGGVASPGHTLVIRETEDGVSIQLGDSAVVPDRDLVIRWHEAAGESPVPSGWACRRDDGVFVLARVVAPQSAPQAADCAHDFYFLVDRSGSMAGIKWEACCRAFRGFLEQLAAQDRAWVTFFESRFQDLAEKPLPPAALLAEPVVQTLERFGTDGGTELLPALEHVIENIGRHSSTRSAAIVLITDGQVGNDASIIERLTQHPEIRVHTFGIDTAVNDSLLRRLAAQNRGSCHLVLPHDDIAAAVARLGARLRQPVLVDISAPDGWEFPDGPPADLHAAEAITFTLRGPAGAFAPAELAIAARDAAGSLHHLDVRTSGEDCSAARLIWMRRRIDHLIATGKQAEAIALARSTNLVCDGTAFVAWDEAENVAIASSRLDIYQPSMQPADWVCDMAAMPAASPPMIREIEPLFAVQSDIPKRSKSFRPFSRGKFFYSPFQSPGPPPPTRLPESPFHPEAPAIASGTGPWRRELESIGIFADPGFGRELLDWLEHWALSDQPDRGRREEMLSRLAASLTKAKSTAEAFEVLESWLRSALVGDRAFLKPTLELLDKMKAVLPAA